jgi:hypothetical protein
MDSERFDVLVQKMQTGSTRRAMVRTGLGALAASALGMLGIGDVAETEAARKPRKSRRGRRNRGSAGQPQPAPARFGNQTPCTSSAQCVSGTCAFNGLGQVCCSQAGQRCGGAFDCCGALLCDVFGTGTCF